MPFLGWLSDPFKWLSDLQLGDEKVTLNHLVVGGWSPISVSNVKLDRWSFRTKDSGFFKNLWDHLVIHIWKNLPRSAFSLWTLGISLGSNCLKDLVVVVIWGPAITTMSLHWSERYQNNISFCHGFQIKVQLVTRVILKIVELPLRKLLVAYPLMFCWLEDEIVLLKMVPFQGTSYIFWVIRWIASTQGLDPCFSILGPKSPPPIKNMNKHPPTKSPVNLKFIQKKQIGKKVGLVES